MRIVLAFAIVLMLSSMALAAPESTQVGPYTAAFDLNTDQNYDIVPMETGEAETLTLYGFQIITDNTSRASVSIRENREPIDTTLDPQKQLSIFANTLAGFNVTSINDITIDGKDGYMLSLVPYPNNPNVPADTRLYEAVYWLDSVECECGPVSVGTTAIGITSSYPEDVTMNLINSLVVTKGEATEEPMGEATAESAQVLPPA